MVVAAFVAPYLLEATARFVVAAAELPGVRLGLVTCEPVERIPPTLRERLDAHWRVSDALDPRQVAWAVSGLAGQLGRVDRLVGALETLQAAGIPCARHALVRGPGEAVAFADRVGFPLVAKPPAGAGAQATFRLDDGDMLRGWLAAVPLGGDSPALLEEFLTGEEHTFDSVTLGGSTVWSSIADYRPPPLEVLRNPWIQWTVVLPRDIGGPRYEGIHRWGPAALKALGVTEGLTHMEWFARPDGSVAVSEVAARPPGPQLTSMHGYAQDFDLYRAWAELVILGRFDVPERRFAAGTAYLRGMGRGRVRAVHGIDDVQQQIGHLVVEARLPQPGQPAGTDYLGEGYAIVRDPDTAVVEDAVHRLVSGVRVELAEA